MEKLILFGMLAVWLSCLCTLNARCSISTRTNLVTETWNQLTLPLGPGQRNLTGGSWAEEKLWGFVFQGDGISGTLMIPVLNRCSLRSALLGVEKQILFHPQQKHVLLFSLRILLLRVMTIFINIEDWLIFAMEYLLSVNFLEGCLKSLWRRSTWLFSQRVLNSKKNNYTETPK